MVNRFGLLFTKAFYLLFFLLLFFELLFLSKIFTPLYFPQISSGISRDSLISLFISQYGNKLENKEKIFSIIINKQTYEVIHVKSFLDVSNLHGDVNVWQFLGKDDLDKKQIIRVLLPKNFSTDSLFDNLSISIQSSLFPINFREGRVMSIRRMNLISLDEYLHTNTDETLKVIFILTIDNNNFEYVVASIEF